VSEVQRESGWQEINGVLRCSFNQQQFRTNEISIFSMMSKGFFIGMLYGMHKTKTPQKGRIH
jgi:hypothetical protein